jgi:Protein of unknown function (DUF3443)
MLSMIFAAAGCGGDGSGSTSGSSGASNSMALVVDGGPLGARGVPVGYANGAFVTVTVCIPGSGNCQDIDHVLVDTGSSGLRLLANDGRAGGKLTLQLPQQRDTAGNAIAECEQFLDGFTWGSVRLADVRLGGETASAIPIQVISEATLAVPAHCASFGVDEDTLEGPSGLLTNGILGVGLFRQDCGDACAVDPAAAGSPNPGLYYACNASGQCTETAVQTGAQVTNPVAMFASDNNGVILQLPSVAATGAPTVTGSVIFGIGTRSNNGLGNATVFPVDGTARILTLFPPNGTSYPSFIDSGSNGIFFLGTVETGLPTCQQGSGFYCPTNPVNLSATNRGANGTPDGLVNFSIGSAEALFSSNNTAFSNLGGPNAGLPSLHIPASFDWGLSFFYGRSVYTAIEGASTPGGTGPYFAY